MNNLSRLSSSANVLHRNRDRHNTNERETLLPSQSQPTIALLPVGDLIEDFLDSIGVSLDAFCEEFTGSWMFGYIDALQLVGVRTVLFCFSARVNAPLRRIHKPTGVQICFLPVPRIYRAYLPCL